MKTVQSKVISRLSFVGKVYQVKSIVSIEGDKRTFTDCEYFKTRKEALEAIPEIDKDLLESNI